MNKIIITVSKNICKFASKYKAGIIMDTNEKQTSKNTPVKNVKPKKKAPVLLIIFTFLLIIAIAILGWQYFEQKKQAEIIQKELELQKEELTGALNELYFQYDSLRTDNDSINIKLEAEQLKIQQLLSIQASNLEKIRLYKKELGTLREVMKSYIVQIDSLNTKNLALIAANVEVTNRLREAESTNIELSKEKEELNSKVEVASVITAKDIIALTLNKRGKEKNKIAKVDKVRVCFTLRENVIAPPGLKDVYIRIYRPDELVLASSEEDLFEFNGEMMIYSAKRQVEYENKDIDMCIFYTNSGDLIIGSYSIEIYLDNNLIGNTTFAIK